jgi:hypothetical protein
VSTNVRFLVIGHGAAGIAPGETKSVIKGYDERERALVKNLRVARSFRFDLRLCSCLSGRRRIGVTISFSELGRIRKQERFAVTTDHWLNGKSLERESLAIATCCLDHLFGVDALAEELGGGYGGGDHACAGLGHGLSRVGHMIIMAVPDQD